MAPLGSHRPQIRHPRWIVRLRGGEHRGAWHLWGHMRPEFAIVARIAFGHHGRVSRRQLMAEGIDAEQIKRWLRDGRLHPVHRGVYAVGHVAPSMHGDYSGAVLAGGGGARLSHAPAAHVFKLTRGKRPPPPEITVPTTAHRRRPGIVIHRVKALHPYDVTVHEGIPITSVPRVLLDMAPRLSATSRTPSSPSCNSTACRSRARTSTSRATRSTATGPSTASRSSCSPSASTPPATPSRRTSRAAAAHSTSPTRTATSSSAPTPPPPSCVSGSRSLRSPRARRARTRRARAPSTRRSGSTSRPAA